MTTRALTHRHKQYSTGQNIELVGYPPYSPYLAPNHFFLFSSVKNELRDQRFSTPGEAVDALKMHVLEITQSEWKSAMKIVSNVCSSVSIIAENILKTLKSFSVINVSFYLLFRIHIKQPYQIKANFPFLYIIYFIFS